MSPSKCKPSRLAEPKIKLHFLGAAGSVTGSLNLLEVVSRDGTVRILIDVGLDHENESNNFEHRLPAGIGFADIDLVIFTHAHIDHSAYYPYMYKQGYRGQAITHRATVDCLKFLLPDSGHLQEQEAAYQNRRQDRARTASDGENADVTKKGQKPSRRKMPAVPLYTQKDAELCLDSIRGVEYDTTYELEDRFGKPCNISMRLTDASHILGSAVVTLEIGRGAKKRRVVFTGNIGRSKSPVLADLVPLTKADYIICESTYGDKLHNQRDRLSALSAELNAAYKRGGVIIIPTFAMSRAQDVLFDIRTLEEQKRIPVMPVFVDSPMAILATKTYLAHSNLFNKRATRLVAKGINLFKTARCQEVSDWMESKKLATEKVTEPTIILASSGMASGGRVVQHLSSRLADKRNTVLFVGFQGLGTLGQRLLSTSRQEIKVGEQVVPVKATIIPMSDYSGHADYSEIIAWLGHFEQAPRKIFLVHGEKDTLPAFKEHIEESLRWTVVIPNLRQCFELM